MSLISLSPAETEQYYKNGFVIIPNVWSNEECDQINQHIDDIIADEQGTRERSVLDRSWILSLGLKSELTEKLASDERFLTLVENLVHPGIAIYSAKLVPKAPHHEAICHWHQDDSYYRTNSASNVRMSVWLALHDADEANGAVHFVPGSHTWGQQSVHEEQEHFCNISILNPDPEKIKTAMCPSIKKGSVVLFHSLTWHYSGPNTTDRARRSFIVSYQDALAEAGNGDQWKILRPADHAHQAG